MSTLDRLLTTIVFEWDASSHSYAYELWAKAIFSDGGEGCRRQIEKTGEPLVEGMLVGKPEDTLTTSQTHQVRELPSKYCGYYLLTYVAAQCGQVQFRIGISR